MPMKTSHKRIPVEKLRWRLDPATLPFETTADLETIEDIIGQERAVEAFRFGININKPGYNVFVTGATNSGRLDTVTRMLGELTKKKKESPDDLLYVNNFKNPEAPILMRLKAGLGQSFEKDVGAIIESLKKEVPQLFESQEYLNRKKEVMEEYEKAGKAFFKDLENKVREQGFALVDVQMGQVKRPEVVPIVDGNPTHIDQVEAMVEKGRFPKEEFEELKDKQGELRAEIDQIFLELRDLQKGVQENVEKMDRLMFMKIATETVTPVIDKYEIKEIDTYLNAMVADMTENLTIFTQQGAAVLPGIPGMPAMVPESDPFRPYHINLLVDNSEKKGPPVIIESHPTYRNVFGSIERIVDRSGVWRTDFSKIKVGSFIKAHGGYLVIEFLDALAEPGVWQTLKRSLRTQKVEIQTYDPFYLFTTTGMKPEPIDVDTKVVIISDLYLYFLALSYDQDVKKTFKVRADFDSAMDKTDESILQFAKFIKTKQEKEKLKPFDRTAVAALVEHAVRMTGRQEKISTSFPAVTDLLLEADYWATREKASHIQESHVDKAIDSRIYRSSMIEEHIQEMIDRGTLMIDADGEVVGQVNGLSVYSLGDYMFGKPTRITASTSMGRAGIINIEREADLSGNTHNKGIFILGGYLRKKYAQDKPLTMSASIAFEQSYGGVDGDSASSTEIYALLSSLSTVPIKQSIAVTGSVNQKGEIQAIGGVNHKIEGYYDCCRHIGLTGKQGVMIPESNVKDLMLRKDVIDAINKKEFHVWSVKTIDEGIEILTGKKAGELQADNTYPKDTINDLVDKRLRSLAEGLKSFGEEDKKEDNKKAGTGKKKK
jgi:ATP-dependent Lon protease